MRHFTCVQDLGDLKQALNEAFEIKKDRFQFSELGKNKTLLMIFFNSSLRTRLSTQKAAMNLGMNRSFWTLTKVHGSWKQSEVLSWMVINRSICWKLFL